MYKTNEEVISQRKFMLKLCVAMTFKEEIVLWLKLLRGNSFLRTRD